jgi:Holliday junction resolvase RusA-like endonuclease
MAPRTPTTFKVDFPAYPVSGAYKGPYSRRLHWRYRINKALRAEQLASGFTFAPDDRVEVAVYMRLRKGHLAMQDLDNLLKDIFDAIQGRVGKPRIGWGTPIRLLQNDNQIYRVIMEKSLATEVQRPGGTLRIRRYRQSR